MVATANPPGPARRSAGESATRGRASEERSALPARLARVGILIAAASAACSQSDAPVTPSGAFASRLAGDYTARTDSLGGSTFWLRFAADGKRIFLSERDNGIRGATEDAWEVVDEGAGRIRVGGSGGGGDGGGVGSTDVIATLSRGDSILTLAPDSLGGDVVYTRSTGMPDPARWVSRIALLAQFDAPGVTPTDLAWDGTGIWFPGGVLGTELARLNPAMNLAIDMSLPAAHSGNAVAYAPPGFWVDDWLERRLYQLWDDTGATRLATRFVAPTDIHGLATLPGDAVCIGAGNAIYVWEMVGGDLDSVDLFQPVWGLEGVGDVLFAALGSGGIARIEGPPWRAQATYALPGIDVRGLAFDGSAWWLYVVDRRAEPVARILHTSLASASREP